MRRQNTDSEIAQINSYIKNKSSKLIYCCSRNSKYKGTWISFRAGKRNIPIDNSDTKNQFYSLKHPGNSIRVFFI